MQLLGEGFNITFHENILKGISKVKEKKLIETEEKDELIGNDNEMNEDDDKSDEIDFEIKDEVVDKAIDITVKRELNKNEKDVIEIKDKMTVIVKEQKQKVDLTKYIEEHKFKFDLAYDQETENEKIY